MKTFATIFASSIALLLSSTAFAFSGHEKEVPQDTREFFVDETKLPFDGVPGLASQRYWGIDDGAGFR